MSCGVWEEGLGYSVVCADEKHENGVRFRV